jgi:dTDP-4-amino-4,6-dideoxygalactose transaminase
MSFNQYLYGMLTYPIGKKLDKKYDFVGKSEQQIRTGYKTNVKIYNKNIQKYLENNAKQNLNGYFMKDQLSSSYNLKWINTDNNFYIFPLRHKDRDAIVAKLFIEGFESGKHFAKSIEWASGFSYKSGSCPNTERVVKEIFTIPVHYTLCEKDLSKIAQIVNSF